MSHQLPPIYFYVPPKHMPQNLPEDPELFGQWQGTQGKRNLGIHDLPIQAYLHLKANNFPCELVSNFPEKGIVLAHRFWLHDHKQPNANLLIVCIRGDRPRHPYAQLHIVQNPSQASPRNLFNFWESYYIPHWRQSGLIKRDIERGDRFENVAYFGYDVNLIPEMKSPSWIEELKALGLTWHIVDQPSGWHDYSYVDVVVAMRCLGRKNDFSWKPGSKLYQAWATGVPAILGYESAFRLERKSEYDYLEATSIEEILTALKKLRDNPELRRKIRENGFIRAKETEPTQLAIQWRNFITDIAVPAYQRWCNTSKLRQQTFLKHRYLETKINSFQKRMGLLAVPEIDRLTIT
ncbi:glycosyltransferase [Crocosphaera sp. XPORK-15E]|uniref:glycosyltransferase n=1 Tax=Crocosphaera sp. XPORK-15E TaxID=3110247 RepID=UPI002B1F984F|nr:glycosyltransferase [Crocosphaera sp. XPORK-15E]MEA5534226.1 glycosyltransferase [Crocosphaera sp. XPORK-15E]